MADDKEKASAVSGFFNDPPVKGNAMEEAADENKGRSKRLARANAYKAGAYKKTGTKVNSK